MFVFKGGIDCTPRGGQFKFCFYFIVQFVLYIKIIYEKWTCINNTLLMSTNGQGGRGSRFPPSYPKSAHACYSIWQKMFWGY